MQQIFSPPSSLLRPLFDVPYLSFVVDAMCAGNSPALIWVDNPAAPRSAFIWDKTHCVYLGGEAENRAFYDSLRGFLTQTLLPGARDRDIGIFKIYTANDGWTAKISDLFEGLPVNTRERSLSRLAPDTNELPAAEVPGFTICPITRELLDDTGRVNRLDLIAEIESCWNSLDLFFARGFGFCALSEKGEIVNWCTAEYVSDRCCGVGIQTVEPYTKRGVASATALAFAHHCVENGWTAHWDSWRANVPSILVSAKAGFRKVLDYSVHIAMLEG